MAGLGTLLLGADQKSDLASHSYRELGLSYRMEQMKLTTMAESDRIKKPNRKRHERECSICSHPRHEEIERDFIEWGSPIRIAQEYGLTARSIVYRHARALGLFYPGWMILANNRPCSNPTSTPGVNERNSDVTPRTRGLTSEWPTVRELMAISPFLDTNILIVSHLKLLYDNGRATAYWMPLT